MNNNVALLTASLLSILLMTFHHADDVVRGMAPGGFSNVVPVMFLAVWLYATVALAGRRSGYIIVLVASLCGLGIPLIHMRGAGLAGGRIAGSSGAFFFVWTLVMVGATSLCSVILSARALRSLRAT